MDAQQYGKRRSVEVVRPWCVPRCPGIAPGCNRSTSCSPRALLGAGQIAGLSVAFFLSIERWSAQTIHNAIKSCVPPTPDALPPFPCHDVLATHQHASCVKKPCAVNQFRADSCGLPVSILRGGGPHPPAVRFKTINMDSERSEVADFQEFLGGDYEGDLLRDLEELQQQPFFADYLDF